MTKQCYNCNKEVTDTQVVDGQIALELANMAVTEFEGWVHCKPTPDQTVGEELARECEKIIGSRANLTDTIVVCAACVWDKVEQERC